MLWIYLSESKVLQYFGNVRYNSAAPDTFAVVTNYITRWNIVLARYSPSDTRKIYLFSWSKTSKYMVLGLPVQAAWNLAPHPNECPGYYINCIWW